MKAIQGYDIINVGGGSMVEPGAYVVRIHKIEDHSDAQSPYLSIYVEIFDPDTKQFTNTAALADDAQSWRYRFSLSLAGEWGAQRYKRFVSAIERSKQNKGFTYVNADGAEQTLVGKWVGMVVRRSLYTKRDGSDGIRPEVSAWITCDDVIEGNYKPEWTHERNTRRDTSTDSPVHYTPAPVVDIADDDLPF